MNKVKKILSEDIFYIKTFFKENQVKKNYFPSKFCCVMIHGFTKLFYNIPYLTSQISKV